MSYIGNEPIVSATRTVTEVTATAGQTVFNANGGYTVGYLDVFLNGSQLQTVDFTATNGSSVTLTEAAQVGDVVRLVAWGTFQSANLNGAGLLDGTVTAAKFASGQTPSFNGITFPATQVASANANTLDDYEEGTWTPVVSFGGVNVTTVSSNCVYTKVGRLVTVTGAIDVTRGSQTGNAKILGFPFAIPTGTYPISAYWSGLGISGQEFMVFNNANDMYFVGRTGISNVNSGNTPTTVFVLIVNVSFNV